MTASAKAIRIAEALELVITGQGNCAIGGDGMISGAANLGLEVSQSMCVRNFERSPWAHGTGLYGSGRARIDTGND